MITLDDCIAFCEVPPVVVEKSPNNKAFPSFWRVLMPTSGWPAQTMTARPEHLPQSRPVWPLEEAEIMFKPQQISSAKPFGGPSASTGNRRILRGKKLRRRQSAPAFA